MLCAIGHRVGNHRAKRLQPTGLPGMRAWDDMTNRGAPSRTASRLQAEAAAFAFRSSTTAFARRSPSAATGMPA